MLFKNLCLRQILGVRVPGGDLCAKRRSTDRGGNKEVFQKALPWDFDETKIRIPVMMLASTEDADIGLITLEDMQTLLTPFPVMLPKAWPAERASTTGRCCIMAMGMPRHGLCGGTRRRQRLLPGGLKLWRMRCIRIRKYK